MRKSGRRFPWGWLLASLVLAAVAWGVPAYLDRSRLAVDYVTESEP